MRNFTLRGLGDEHSRDDQHGTGRYDGRRRHHRGNGPGRRHGRPALPTDQPVGTTPDALAEAFLGIGQLLRSRARFHRHGPRRESLTFARAALLATLDSDGPQRMGQLAHRLGVVPRTVTPMVDALEQDALVAREPDPDDRRATVLRITDAGRKELTQTRSDRRDAVDEVFASLSDDERSVLAGVLDTLRNAARAGLADVADADPRPAGPAQGDSAHDGHPGARPGRRGPGGRSREGRAHHVGAHHGRRHRHGHGAAGHSQWRPA